MPHYNRAFVYSALTLGLIAFGFAPILVRFAADTSPFVLVTYRTVFAAFLLLPYWAARQPRSEKPRITTKEGLQVIVAGICLGLHFTCWVSSLYYTSVASASVLVTIHPILVILVERFLFKRRFMSATWAGVALAFAGSVLLGISDSQVVQSFPDPLFGNALAFTAAAIFVVYLFIGQRIRQRRAWIDYVFPVYAVAAFTCLVLTWGVGESLLDITRIGLWCGFGLALGPQILGHGSMNYAIKYISPTLLSTLILIEPLLASLLALFIFNEWPPLLSILAMTIIMIGIGLTWKRKKTSSQP